MDNRSPLTDFGGTSANWGVSRARGITRPVQGHIPPNRVDLSHPELPGWENNYQVVKCQVVPQLMGTRIHVRAAFWRPYSKI